MSPADVLARLMLERAKTAREAIQIAGQLLEQYGWADAGEALGGDPAQLGAEVGDVLVGQRRGDRVHRREESEVRFADGRAIVKGTSDTGVARSLYARYVG